MPEELQPHLFFLIVKVNKFDVKIRLILSTSIVLVVNEYIGLVLISGTSFHKNLLSLIDEFLTPGSLLSGFIKHVFLLHAFPEHISILKVLEAMPQTKSEIVYIVLLMCMVFSKNGGEIRSNLHVRGDWRQ